MKKITKEQFESFANKFKGDIERTMKLLISNGFVEEKNNEIYLTSNGVKLQQLEEEKNELDKVLRK